MVLLVLSEFTSYMSTTRTEHIVVDTTIGQRLKINFNLTFHSLPCNRKNESSFCYVRAITLFSPSLFITFPPFQYSMSFTFQFSYSLGVISDVIIECNLDAMDISGEQHLDSEHTIHKVRLASDGAWIGDKLRDNLKAVKVELPPLPDAYCGPCYGAQETEDEVYTDDISIHVLFTAL